MIRKIIACLLLTSLVACQDFDPLDGVTISIDYDLFETFVSFRFIDGSTGDLIGAQDLSSVITSFSGKHKDAVLTQVGERPEHIQSVFGLVSVALNPFEPHRPEAGKPIEFTLHASASGFEDASYSFAIADTGYFSYSVIMPPAGWKPENPSDLRINIGSVESGRIEDRIKTITPGNAMTLDLKAGTLLKDAMGEAVSGKVNLRIKSFRAFNQTAIRQQKILTVEQAGQLSQVVIEPVLLTEILLQTDAGVQITQFSGDSLPSLSFKLDDWSDNQEGLSVWSMSGAEEIWSFEGNPTISKADTVYYAQLDLKHLSWFTAGRSSPTRGVTGQINLSFERAFLAASFPGEALITSLETGELIHRIELTLAETTIDFDFSVPAEEAVLLRLRAKSGDYEFSTTPASLQIATGETSFQQNLSLKPLKCPFAGNIRITPDGNFPYYPIPARIRIRNNDNQATLKTINIDITAEQTSFPFFVMLPEGTALSCSIEPRALANDFLSLTNEISFSSSCEENAELPFTLSSNTCNLNGSIQFKGQGTTEGDDNSIRMLIRRSSDNRLIHNRIISINANQLNYPLSLSIPKATEITLDFESVNDDNPLAISPNQISIADPCNPNFQAIIEYSSSLIKLAGTINFNLDPLITQSSLPIKLAYLDWKTEEVLKETDYELLSNEPSISYSTLVQDAPVLLRVTRNDPNGLFITEPYLLKIPDPKNAASDWTVDLIKTEKKLVRATLKVVCPAGEIRPTIQGYYRIPGENWKELFIVGGNLLILAEMKATYEVGVIFDGQMTDSTFTVTSQNIEMTFELDPADCEKMGWGK